MTAPDGGPTKATTSASVPGVPPVAPPVGAPAGPSTAGRYSKAAGTEPLGSQTRSSCQPTVPGGVTISMVASLMRANPGAVAPPTVTDVAPVKPQPSTSTRVPPLAGPNAGRTSTTFQIEPPPPLSLPLELEPPPPPPPDGGGAGAAGVTAMRGEEAGPEPARLAAVASTK